MGLLVFPLAYKPKSPLNGSHGGYDGTTAQAIIIQLFAQGLYNVAICTGDVSGIAGLDIDAHKGGLESFKAVVDEYSPPFDTDGPKIITCDNGWQFPFQMPAAMIRSGVGNQVWANPGCKKRVQRAIAAMNGREH
jgi:hypothetical protein